MVAVMGAGGCLRQRDRRITISVFNRCVYCAQRNELVREVFCFYWNINVKRDNHYYLDACEKNLELTTTILTTTTCIGEWRIQDLSPTLHTPLNTSYYRHNIILFDESVKQTNMAQVLTVCSCATPSPCRRLRSDKSCRTWHTRNCRPGSRFDPFLWGSNRQRQAVHPRVTWWPTPVGIYHL